MQPTTLLADSALQLQSERSAALERAARERHSAPAVRVTRPGRRHLGWLPLAAVVALILGGLGYVRVWPPLAIVMSASMEPTIKTGDMVVLKRLAGPAQIGDVVVVSVPDEARARYGYPPVVIHRIVSIAAGGTVTTKGDAKKEPDPFTVPRRTLTAKVVGHIPAGGRVFAFFTSPLGLLWLTGGVLLFFGMPVLDRRRDARDREQVETVSVHEALTTITSELALLRSERSQPRPEPPDARAELERALEAATIRAAASQEQLRAVTAALTAHLEQLPAQIERAVAAAVGALAAAPVQPIVILAPERIAPPKHAAGPLPDLWPAQAPDVSASSPAVPALDLWPGQAPQAPAGPAPDLWPAQALELAADPVSDRTRDLWPGQALQAPAGPAPDLWPGQALEPSADPASDRTGDLWPGQAPQLAAAPVAAVPTPDLWPAQAPKLLTGRPSDPTADLWPGEPPRLTTGGRRPVSLTGPAPDLWPAPPADFWPPRRRTGRFTPDAWPTQDLADEPSSDTESALMAAFATAPEIDAESAAERDAETALTAAPEAGTAVATAPEIDTDSAAELDAESAEAEPEAETAVEAEPQAEVDAESAEAEPEAETAVEAEPQAEVDAESAAEVDAEPGSEDPPDPEAVLDALPDEWPVPTPDLIPALRPSIAPPMAPVHPPSVGPPGSPSWDALPPALRKRRSGGLLNSADRFARRALASNAVRSRLSVIPRRGSLGRPF